MQYIINMIENNENTPLPCGSNPGSGTINGSVPRWDALIPLRHEKVEENGFIIHKKYTYDDYGHKIYEASEPEGSAELEIKMWYSNGQLKRQVKYLAGKKHGNESGWYENGSLWYEIINYCGEKEYQEKYYYQNGQLRTTCSWLNGEKNGLEAAWYENGNKCFERNWINGIKHGHETEWYGDGQKKKEVAWNHGRINGKMREWVLWEYLDHRPELKGVKNPAPECIFIKECNYVNGQKHGLEIVHGPGSAKSTEAYFENVKIPVHYWNYPETITVHNIFAMSNLAVRRALLKMMGYERFLSQLPDSVIHRDGNYSLHRVKNPFTEIEPMVFLKVKCSSTGAWYVLRVPPQMRTCRRALAWTFGMNSKEYRLDDEA